MTCGCVFNIIRLVIFCLDYLSGNKLNLERLFAKQVKPALGCTEIVAIGYASSLAFGAILEKTPHFFPSRKDPSNKKNVSDPEILQVKVDMDRNVYKNARAVYIPLPKSIKRKAKGVEMASALGIFCDFDNFERTNILTLFDDLTSSKYISAKQLIRSVKFDVDVVDNWTGKSDLDIVVEITAQFGNKKIKGKARLQHEPDNVTFISQTGRVLYRKNSERKEDMDRDLSQLSRMSISRILGLAQSLPDSVKKRLEEGIDMNMALAEEGLTGRYGLKVGKSLKRVYRKGIFANGLITECKMYAAAACDARMGGARKAAMSTAQSGNQGISATIPLIVTAMRTKYNKKKLIEALAVAHLITAYIAYYSGNLSAMCGCSIKAGIGSAAGLTYYLGGNIEKVRNAIKNMSANITGMICDGAKEGCALKISASVGCAIESALLALDGVQVPSDNGIVETRAENTLQNIGKVSDGMIGTDRTIVQDILLRSQK
ncbi:MAG: L-serine ammonia-lyase, iron-sulfur-dependent, subunit alpha [Patescibacteria group bacterium]|nr:L-serine ammonia-lyase, iron-sulfur-dependent, subunit alpha [Patescibacteria group bacterium]